MVELTPPMVSYVIKWGVRGGWSSYAATQERMWTNPNEIPDNGIDDDGSLDLVQELRVVSLGLCEHP